MSTIASYLPFNISETVRDRCLIPRITNTSQLNFAFELPSVVLPKRLIKFESATEDS